MKITESKLRKLIKEAIKEVASLKEDSNDPIFDKEMPWFNTVSLITRNPKTKKFAWVSILKKFKSFNDFSQAYESGEISDKMFNLVSELFQKANKRIYGVNESKLKEDIAPQVLRHDQIAKIAKHLHDTGMIKNIIDVQTFLKDKANINVSKNDALKIKQLATSNKVRMEAADGSLNQANRPQTQTAVNLRAIQNKQKNNKFSQNIKVVSPRQIKDLMKADPDLSNLPHDELDKRVLFLAKKYMGKTIPYSFLFFNQDNMKSGEKEQALRTNLNRESKEVKKK